MLGQVLRQGVLLVVGPDLLLAVNPRMRRESRLYSISHVAAPGEVGAGQEGAEGGAALLHHLNPEPNPLAVLLHDLVDACDQPPVRWIKIRRKYRPVIGQFSHVLAFYWLKQQNFQ